MEESFKRELVEECKMVETVFNNPLSVWRMDGWGWNGLHLTRLAAGGVSGKYNLCSALHSLNNAYTYRLHISTNML